eukprot:COSAG02_NODE_67742_length_252_cov_0.673203_1_plen_21_part_01
MAHEAWSWGKNVDIFGNCRAP